MNSLVSKIHLLGFYEFAYRRLYPRFNYRLNRDTLRVLRIYELSRILKCRLAPGQLFYPRQLCASFIFFINKKFY